MGRPSPRFGIPLYAAQKCWSNLETESRNSWRLVEKVDRWAPIYFHPSFLSTTTMSDVALEDGIYTIANGLFLTMVIEAKDEKGGHS